MDDVINSLMFLALWSSVLSMTCLHSMFWNGLDRACPCMAQQDKRVNQRHVIFITSQPQRHDRCETQIASHCRWPISLPLWCQGRVPNRFGFATRTMHPHFYVYCKNCYIEKISRSAFDQTEQTENTPSYLKARSCLPVEIIKNPRSSEPKARFSSTVYVLHSQLFQLNILDSQTGSSIKGEHWQRGYWPKITSYLLSHRLTALAQR